MTYKERVTSISISKIVSVISKTYTLNIKRMGQMLKHIEHSGIQTFSVGSINALAVCFSDVELLNYKTEIWVHHDCISF